MAANDTWKTLDRRRDGTPSAGRWVPRTHPENDLALDANPRGLVEGHALSDEQLLDARRDAIDEYRYHRGDEPAGGDDAAWDSWMDTSDRFRARIDQMTAMLDQRDVPAPPETCAECHKPLSADRRHAHACSAGLETEVLDPADTVHRALVVDLVRRAHESGVSDPAAVQAHITASFAASGVVVIPDAVAADPEWGALVRNEWPPTEPDRTPLDDMIGPSDALTWKGAGFRPADMAAWSQAGVFTPELARRCADAGITIDQARRPGPSDTGWYPPLMVGELLESGTWTIADATAAEPVEAEPRPDIGF